MNLFRRRDFVVVTLAILLFSSLASILQPFTASAYLYRDTTLTTEAECTAVGGVLKTQYDGSERVTFCEIRSSASQDSEIILYSAWLAGCMDRAIVNDTTYDLDEMKDYALTAVGDEEIGHFLDPGNGQLDCGNGDNIKKAADTLGYANMMSLLSDLGCILSGTTYSCGNLLKSDDTGATTLGDRGMYNIFVSNKYADIGIADYTKYFIALSTFESGCKATEIQPDAYDQLEFREGSDHLYEIKVLGDDMTSLRTAMYRAELGKGREITTVNGSAGWDNGTFSCAVLANMANTYSNSYLAWARLNPVQAQNDSDSTVGGFLNGDETTVDGASSCPVEGIGWIVCPIINAVSGLSDSMYGIIENILLMNPLTINDPSTGEVSSTYKMWQPIRDVANVLLVIAFLILIFSQLTNLGIDNYGIKKMLPRIIIAALAINLSYFAMMIAVDAANLMGRGIHDALGSIASSAWVPGGITFSWEGFFTGLTAVGVGAVVGVGVAASVSFSALFLMALPFLLGAFLAILAAFLTLYVRNALVIILAVLAPLAFAAYLLPNTQSLFTKWRKLIISMLMLYPVAALLFAGAKLAGILAVQLDDPFSIMIGLFITAAPLFMLPWLAKSSGGILAKVGGQLGKMGKSLQGSAQKGLSPMVQQRKDERRGQLNAGERTLNPFGKVREPNQSRDTRAYKNLRKELETGKRTGESDADWNTRRSGLERKANIMERHGEHARIQQPLAQRLALGKAKREANIGRLKKQPGEQLKELAEGGGDIDPATGLSRLERAGYSNRGLKMAAGAGSIFEREARSDTKAKEVDARIKQRFEAGNKDVLVAAKAAETDLTAEQARTGTVFEIEHREGAIVNAKAAEAGLKTEQDRTGQLAEELSTEAGAARNPALQAVARELHVAHEGSQVAQMATDSAKRVGTQEFADQIIQPTSGLAARAGGIDPQGEARAVSKARAAVASAREESIGNIVNDHKLHPERSAAWHLQYLSDPLNHLSVEEEAASIRRIGEIGGVSDVIKLTRLTPTLRSNEARDEAKGVIARKLADKIPAFMSQMPNMSNAEGGAEPTFSEEDAWTSYITGDTFTLNNFLTLQEQQKEILRFTSEPGAKESPAREDMLIRLQRIKEQLDESPEARQKISSDAYDKLEVAIGNLTTPSTPAP